MAVLYRFPAGPQPYVAGSAVTGVTALTSGLVGTQVPVIPGGILQPGARICLRAHIEVTSTSSTPTLTLGFYFGPVNTAIGSEILLGATAALPISASATGFSGTMVYNGTVRALATGPTAVANGTIHGSGEIFWFGSSGLTAAGAVYPLGATLAGRTVATYNDQVPQQLDIGITWSSSAGSDSATVTDFFAEITG